MAFITISLINQKGGCGKTSSCFHLAGSLAESGFNTLLVDADPQGSLSHGFLGSEFVENLQPHETLARLFDERWSFLDHPQLIRPTGFENISILPANQHLAVFNSPSPELGGVTQFTFSDFMERLKHYDVVLIDCPPNLFQCSWSAMIASDYVLIPVPPEAFGGQGLRSVHQAINNAARLNPKLQLLGHIVTRYDRRLLVHRSYEGSLRTLYGDDVLQTVVPEAAAFKVAATCRKPVQYYSPRSIAAIKMRELALEINRRITSAESLRRLA